MSVNERMYNRTTWSHRPASTADETRELDVFN